ncbi:MAG: NADH-quinone oxidoreductase subunit NuoE [Candidatus Bipolaricaulota bacterium]|nr:MAG: NADH-quinone oxidoreductase subunit NuoE [Candidatus Bipolaricaulota bacterium]
MAGSESPVITADELAERLAPILSKYLGKEGAVISLLQDVQEEFGFLEERAMTAVADALRLPVSHLYGVASFYAQFYFEPRGRNIVRICTGTACHIRGAPAIQTTLEEELGISAGETTDDLEFTLETVNCVGCCALAPVVMVGDQVVRRKELQKVINALKETEE